MRPKEVHSQFREGRSGPFTGQTDVPPTVKCAGRCHAQDEAVLAVPLTGVSATMGHHVLLRCGRCLLADYRYKATGQWGGR